MHKNFILACAGSLSSALWIVLATAGLAGCGNTTGPSRAAIEGRVTIGGQPLRAGRILFTPLSPAEGPASSAAIVDGRYRIERSEGPVVGRNRVEVEAELDLGFSLDDDQAFAKRRGQPWPQSPIPSEFNRLSQLTADVKERNENRFDVTVPAAHAAARHPY